MKWPTVSIDAIKANGSYSLVGGPFGSNLTTRDYKDEGVPVIRGTNLPDDDYFSEEDFVYISESKADELTPNTAFPGDVVFTQRGTLGQVGWIPPTTACHSRYIISQSQMKLTVNETVADARFVYYYFRTPIAVQTVRNRAITSGVPHINLGILKGLEIPLPPIKVQRRIVNVLCNFDTLINNNRRRIHLLEEAARLLYREWFVRLRFPGHEHTRTAEGVPEGWCHKRLSTVSEINRKNLPNGHDGTIQYVDISSVSPGQIGETTEYVFREAPSRARRVVTHGDTIWSCVRPNRRSYALIWDPPANLVVSTGFAVITPTTLPAVFLYCAITTDSFVGYLENRARGAAYPAVVAGDFGDADVLVPPPSLLRVFDEHVSPIFAQIHNLRSQNEKLQQARNLLLPRLMNGNIAV